MSATPEQVKHINASFEELKRRLASKGVVMETSKENGQALVSHLIKEGTNYLTATPEDLYRAFTALYPTGAIKFEKGREPGPLKSKAPLQGTHAATVKAQAELGNREQMAKVQAEKEAEAKRESVAQKDVENAIAAFALTKGGSMRYAPTQEFQKLLKQNVDKFRRDGMKWQLIFPVVKTWIADKYKEWDNENEKSSSGGW
jgi:hypothetical protein